jgi:N-acetylglucosamine-6-phosphate deacetylase
MIVLAGAVVALPDRVLPNASLLIANGRIEAIEAGTIDGPAGASRIDCAGQTIVPGFVDVHVHGVEGIDVLDGADAVTRVAQILPRYGVTSFCPTSIACDPATLTDLLQQVRNAHRGSGGARVLPAHLESNFINADYKGAQPAACLRVPRVSRAGPRPTPRLADARSGQADFSADDILEVITAHRREVGIVTLAPEIEGGMDLIRDLSAAGHRVSIGHTGATYEQSLAAIEAGATHATHLFNRMTPMTHRAPGVPGAVLHAEAVAAELICDGFHVHPALLRVAINCKGASRVMAITDGTAGSGLPVGSRTRLGGRTIIVTDRTAELEDGTLAGSVLTMDAAFRQVMGLGCSLVEAARMCATTPASQMRLDRVGEIAVGWAADLTVLDSNLRVVRTLLGGEESRNPPPYLNV